jgi:DNA-directed RNA polymerase sigma subunit (sigma70/sigma32)
MTTFTTEDRLNALTELEPIPFAGMVDVNAVMTQEAVALALGVSRQTVCNIERSIFKKLRKELFKRGYDRDDLL